MKGILASLIFLWAVSYGSAFVVPTGTTKFLDGSARVPTNAWIPTTSTTLSTSLLAFNNKNKKKQVNQEPERVKVTDPLQLLILYATPWYNPNSIFVYLFALLYALGKYSEAQSMAGQ